MPTARSFYTKTIFVLRDPIYKLIAVAAPFDRIFSSSATAIQMPFFTFRIKKLISLLIAILLSLDALEEDALPGH